MEDKIIEEKIKYKYILPPCPSYDIESMENWLREMALDGWVLCNDGFFCGFATFEKTNPSYICYRLEAVPKKIGLLSNDDDYPADEDIESSRLKGWKYIASRGQFYIYCKKTSSVRDLHIDPQKHVLAIESLRKRERNNMISSLLCIIFSLALKIRGNPLLIALSIDSLFFILFTILLLWIFIGSVLMLIHLRRLRKKLSQEETLKNNKDWKTYANVYRIGRILFISIIFVFIGIIVNGWFSDIYDKGLISLQDYNGTLPFATIKDLAPNGTYTLNDAYETNTIKFSSSLLAPTIIELRENATIRLEDGTSIQGMLSVNYYEAATPWIAKEIAREYKVEAEKSKYYEKLDLIELNVDYAVAYEDIFPYIIVQYGKKVMRINFYQIPEGNEKQLNNWATIFANSLK